MGEQNNAEMALFYAKDGKFEKIEGVKEFPAFQTGEVETTEAHHLHGFNGGSASFKIKRPKSLRCKSRKRFIKLLMSKGMPRNMAVKIASYKPENESYDFMWFRIRLMCVANVCRRTLI